MRPTRLISTSVVRPTAKGDQFVGRIELTPWDLQLILAEQVQRGLLFHKPTSTDDKSFIQHLKSSLSLTLDIFYPLAGRLAITENEDDHTTSFHLECNGAGAEFIHAIADGVTVADILDPVLIPDDIVNSFCTMDGVLNYESSLSKPCLALQVTELVDGVFISCTMNHCLVDGPFYWRFFNAWSEICRRQMHNNLYPCASYSPSGEKVGTIAQSPPVYSREFFKDIIDLPVRIPFFHSQIPNKLLRPPLQHRIFHFTKEKISEIKAKANAERGTKKISSLQSLMAHLWVAITRVKCLNPNQEIKYRILVGMRQRLIPPLPEEYFGNAILFATVTTTVGDLLKHGVGWAALEMNKAIALTTDEEARVYLKEWMVSPKLTKLDLLVCDSLMTGSSPRFNVYGNDFGWGRPLAIRTGRANKFDGKMWVFEGAEEGSIDFEASLSPQTMQALANDAQFMESISGG